ncbi:MAG TPA: RNA polymerase sigma factor [Bryobacteraceae bacterium]|jgi:RNA polymerase sigma-70 factor (ECF subfamily)|nr:RNA polymerase sigma factor [Bryobacteraceae bacterium]
MAPDLIDFDAPPIPQPSWKSRVNYSRADAGPIRETCDRDSELMLRVRDGDQGSFELLLEKHRGPMIHFLYRMVQNDAVAEELSQEVFLRVYKSRGNYEPSAKFTTWLFRIGTHLALNWIRDGRNEKSQTSLDKETPDGAARQVPDRRRTVEQELLYQAKLREVRQAIQSLPLKQRAAVMMHKYEEMEYAQIAGVIGCSESAVKSLIFRAYEALRGRLAHMA